MRHPYPTLAAVLCAVTLAPSAWAQTATTGYTVFARGIPIGREEVTVTTDTRGTTISSQSRVTGPAAITVRKAEIRYQRDWAPESFTLDSAVDGGEFSISTTFRENAAVTEGAQRGAPFSRTHPVDPRAFILLPNAFFGAFEALTRRLIAEPTLTDLQAYVVPQTQLAVKVSAAHADRMQVGTTLFDVRRYEIAIANPEGPLGVTLTATADGHMVRVTIPGQSVDVVRDDVAASTSRTQVFSNPGDEAVFIPAFGFNLGATVTKPKGAPARAPAVVLLAAAGVGDRDGAGLGVPTLAHLAGAIADAGFLVVRYDKRGSGQSGGRPESATLTDFADDTRSVLKWLADRKDVDPKRIALVGHGEGAWIGMLAASRDTKGAALVSLAGASVTGAELLLEQQQAELDRLTLTPEERASRVALQKQLQAAALAGKGWEGVPPALRRDADTPWFQSLLAFDPAQTVKRIKQPMLFVHGSLDKQVPVSHVDRLSDLARKTSDSKSVEVVTVRGVNHLLVPATTGEISEYATLTDQSVSADVASAVTAWLTKTLPAGR
jgi:pimeloyl-ACP methyl ester carboxylesterase